MQENKTYELEVKRTIDDDGNETHFVDVPDELLEVLRWSKQDELEWVEEDGKIIIKKKEASDVQGH